MATNEVPQRITAVCSCGKRFTVNQDRVRDVPECPECGDQVIVRPPGPPPSVKSRSQSAPIKSQTALVGGGRGRTVAVWLIPMTLVIGAAVAISVYKWSSRPDTADADHQSATSNKSAPDQNADSRNGVPDGSTVDQTASRQTGTTAIARAANQPPAPTGRTTAKKSPPASGKPAPASVPPSVFKLSVTPAVELRRLMRIQLDHLRTLWTANTKQTIADKKARIAQLMGQIAQEKRAMDHVQRNTKHSSKILRGLDRRLWFSQTKSKVSSFQQELNARVGEVNELEYVLSHNLYPISSLENRRKNGDIGTLANGHVTRIVNATDCLARFGSGQFYCQNFKTFHPTVGTAIDAPILVVVSGTYRDSVKTGVVVQPVLDPEIAHAYALGTAYRQKKESERAARRKNRISENREAIKKKTGFPILGTVYEPKELILIVRGRIKPKPPKISRGYRIITSTSKVFVAMQGFVTRTSRKRVETATSRRRRAVAMGLYLRAKADFVAFALDAFIQDIRTKIRGGQIRDESGRLRSLSDKLAKDAFGVVDGYDYRKNTIKAHLRSIIGGIMTVAIEYGKLPAKASAGR